MLRGTARDIDNRYVRERHHISTLDVGVMARATSHDDGEHDGGKLTGLGHGNTKYENITK